MAFPILRASAGTAEPMVRPSSHRHVRRIPMNMALAGQFWDMYHGHEPILDTCVAHRNDATFKGGIEINWGGGEIAPVRLDSDAEQTGMMELFRKALEWRDTFGMVPVIVRRRAKAQKNKPLITIPPFGTGTFVIEYNFKTMEMNVVYEVPTSSDAASGFGGSAGPNAVQMINRRALSGRGSARSNVRILDVFVWPGREPSLMGDFRSTIQALMQPFTRIAELRDNMLTADRTASRPTVFTESRVEHTGVEEMTERVLMGQVGDPSTAGPEQRQHYERDVHRTRRLEQMVAQHNAAARSGVSVPAVSADSRLIEERIAPTFSGNIASLPDGETLSRAVVATSRTDIRVHEDTYFEQICSAMGVPYAYISGRGGSKIKGETDHLRTIFRRAVDQDRYDVNSFYQWVHELMHRRKDDAYLEQVTAHANDVDGAMVTPSEKARMRAVRSHIDAIRKLPHRVAVTFLEDPLPRSLDPAILASAVEAGALSEMERFNLLRGQLGLPSLADDHLLFQGHNPDGPATPAVVVSPRQQQQSSQPKTPSTSSTAAAAAAAAATSDSAGSTRPTKDAGASADASSDVRGDSEAEGTTRKPKRKRDATSTTGSASSPTNTKGKKKASKKKGKSV